MSAPPRALDNPCLILVKNRPNATSRQATRESDIQPALQKLTKTNLDRTADGLAAAIAASLPWSTSATSILVVIWLVAVIPTLSWPGLRQELVTSAGGLPVLLWLFAFVGIFWADVTVSERFSALGSYHKLLVIPLLLFQFRRSERIHWVTISFLASSIVLALISWLPVFYRPWADSIWRKWEGVPVHDYISQIAIFQLCALGLIYAAFDAWRGQHKRHAVIFVALAVLFLGNLAYVVSSRTAILLMPALFLLFAFRLYRWHGAIITGIAIAVLSVVAWSSSHSLQTRFQNFVAQIAAGTTANEITASAFRIEFYKKALAIIAKAPIVGHGTGTIRAEFETSSIGKSGIDAVITNNPHNQTLTVAIQLGILGALALWAMWIAHLLLFRNLGMIEWFGFLVVAQNIFSCLVNSHLSDFTEGWIYVVGVGALGGAALRGSRNALIDKPDAC